MAGKAVAAKDKVDRNDFMGAPFHRKNIVVT